MTSEQKKDEALKIALEALKFYQDQNKIGICRWRGDDLVCHTPREDELCEVFGDAGDFRITAEFGVRAGNALTKIEETLK